MDKDKDGKFSLHDLMDFATLYHERQARQDVVDFLVNYCLFSLIIVINSYLRVNNSH